MTTKTNASRTLRTAAATLAITLATAGTLAVAAPAPTTAYAATATRAVATQTATAKHYNGESVSIKTIGGTVYAEWYKVGKAWKAVFATTNGTKIYATPSGTSWNFAAVTKKGLVPVMRTQYESKTCGKLGPKGISSHWRARNANVWY